MSRQGLCLGAVARWPLSGHKSLLSPPASSTPGPRSAKGPVLAPRSPRSPHLARRSAPRSPRFRPPSVGPGASGARLEVRTRAREAGGQCLPCRVPAPEQ